MAGVRQTPSTPGWSKAFNKAGIKEIEKVSAKLTAFAERLKDPQPALNDITMLFGLMEAERFANKGTSSLFGTSPWQPLASSTITERAAKGGNPNDHPLVDRGYLAKAATFPEAKFFGAKSLEIVVDVSKSSPEKKDYGFYHQVGGGIGGRGNPAVLRQFVTITPEFLTMSSEIVKWYVLDDIRKAETEKPETPTIDELGERHKSLRRDIRRSKKNYEKTKRVNRAVRDPIDREKPEVQSFGEYMHTLYRKSTPEAHEKALAEAKKYESATRTGSLPVGTPVQKIEAARFYLKAEKQYQNSTAAMRLK